MDPHPSPCEIDIDVASAQWRAAIPGIEELCRATVAAALDEHRPAEVSLLLTDDAAVQVLNRDWRGMDKPTNVLSFPAPEQPAGQVPRHLGDMALACETLAREAEDESKTLADHFAHLIVHGTLHLLGYDHELEAQAEIMESLEVKALATLGIADPYGDMAA